MDDRTKFFEILLGCFFLFFFFFLLHPIPFQGLNLGHSSGNAETLP